MDVGNLVKHKRWGLSGIVVMIHGKGKESFIDIMSFSGNIHKKLRKSNFFVIS